MIITADEDIIDQIDKTNDASLLKQIMLESEAINSKNGDQQVSGRIFWQIKMSSYVFRPRYNYQNRRIKLIIGH